VDALVDTQQNGGVVVVQGEASHASVSAEALLWAGGATNNATADALTFAVTMRESHGLGEFRVGRFLFASGAILPVQIDGAAALVRSPWGTKVEAVVGAPVVPSVGSASSALVPSDFQWLFGGRVSQMIASRMVVGVSYLQRRDGDAVADESMGMDLAANIRWLDVAARATYDITSFGISEALASAATRVGDFRFELYASDRSPSRLLPATSLFAVFGDFPSQSIGGSIHWKAAPRLDLWLTGVGQSVGLAYGGNGSARALLKLDDRGDGSVGVEVRRQDVGAARWTGIRATATKPFLKKLRASTELELVVPDDSSKGAAWPWALVSLGWRPCKRWELGGALEAAATPVHEFEFNALARLSIFLGAK
jgi:hypothetical protein